MENKIERTVFEIVRENLRATLRYLRYDLQMPPESIKLQVEAILNSFLIEEMNLALNRKDTP